MLPSAGATRAQAKSLPACPFLTRWLALSSGRGLGQTDPTIGVRKDWRLLSICYLAWQFTTLLTGAIVGCQEGTVH